MPVSDRCQPPSAFTRRARPPPQIGGGDRTTGRSRGRGCCPRKPPRRCGGRCRSATDASRRRPSRGGLVLLLSAVPLPRPGAATTALRVGEATLERLPRGRLVRVLVFRLQQLPQLAGLLGR